MKKFFCKILTLFCALSVFIFHVNAEEIKKTSSEIIKTKIENPDINSVSLPEINENPGIIEKNFNLELKQIGYKIFNKELSSKGNKFEKSHKLNIGDRLKLYFWGDSVDMLYLTGKSIISHNSELSVDTTGSIFLAGIGVIYAEGKTIREVEKEIKASAGSKYGQIKVRLILDNVTDFSLNVYGFVNMPGKVNINNNFSIIEALTAAGGVTKNGTLRTISYESNGKTTVIDLYEIIFKGKNFNFKLKSGDKIFVPYIGKTVAIKDGVKVPGIYEIKDNDTSKKLVSYAGGFLPSVDRTTLLRERFDNLTGERKAEELSFNRLNDLILLNGDIISFKTFYNNAENFVTIEGNIKHPGIFEYKEGLTLSDLLKSDKELLGNTFTAQAVIERVAGPNKEIITLPVSLIEFFDGNINPKLLPQDVIKIYPSTRMRTVEVAGLVKNPGLVPYTQEMTLDELLKSVEFGNPSEIHPVSLISRKSGFDSSRLAAEISNPSNEEEVKTVYLYDLMTKNKINANITLNADDKILFRPVTDKEALRTVKVYGYVNNPGIFKLKPGMKLSDALKEAGGISENGFLKGTVFKRPSVGAAQRKALKDLNIKTQLDITAEILKIQENKITASTYAEKFEEIQNREAVASREKIHSGRINLKINTNNINKLSDDENIEIKDGDEIYIPLRSNHVIVVGEVYNQSGFNCIKEMQIKNYIEKAGGFTKRAEKRDVYILSVNGDAVQVRNFKQKVEPGDTIIVPKKVNRPVDWLDFVTKIADIGMKSLSTIFIITKI